MPAPHLFLVDVTDVELATTFYADLFDLTPVMVTPRYLPFEVAPGGTLRAVERTRGRAHRLSGPHLGGRPDGARQARGRRCVHAAWAAKDVAVVEAPHDAVFGRTFVVTDPDGNLVRVAPLD